MLKKTRILVKRHILWLGQEMKTKYMQNKEKIEVETPYLDRHNDRISFFVKKGNELQYVLTDEGYTISDLRMCGININLPEIREDLNKILNGLNVCLEENKESLFVLANDENFASKMHKLIQAMIGVNYLFFYRNREK